MRVLSDLCMILPNVAPYKVFRKGVRFGQSSSIAIAADAFDLAEPNSLAIAEFIKLADLRAQHAPQMMRRFALHDGGFARKLLHEESSTHGGDSSLDTVPRAYAGRKKKIASSPFVASCRGRANLGLPDRDSRPVLADR